MRTQGNEAVAVVAVGGEPTPNLKRLCESNGWLCLVADEVLAIVRTIRRSEMLVVIVEVGPARIGCMELIEKLTSVGRGTVIAVAVSHAGEIEQQARAAGAHWYVPSTHEPTLIEQMVQTILDSQQMISGRACIRVVRPIEADSSSPPIRTYGRRA